MCGIGGYFSPIDAAHSGDVVLTAMGEAMSHRGPDDAGIWNDPAAGIGFTHRRLAIVDTSPAGHQPMKSSNARYVIVYNGEIYNHMDLRHDLASAGHHFNWVGHSDTETLLAAIQTWGLEASLQRCIGMFALALWDRQAKTLTLARDRMGEKPLYYGWQGSGTERTLLFSSELKVLKAHPSFTATVDRSALALYLRHNYVPAPYSIYQGIQKLEPGHIVDITANGNVTPPRAFWSLAEVAAKGMADPLKLSDTEMTDTLEVALSQAVGRQMMADVPLGAFLSGGVDSSAIVALMQAQSTKPIRTFTIGFTEAAYDEAIYARAVADHLHTHHEQVIVSGQQALDVIPRLPTLYDEPFADSSQIPTYLVSQMARQHVTVALSGDAGDELFCGYNRYAFTRNLWSKLSRVPTPLRNAAAAAIQGVSPQYWDGILAPFLMIMPSSKRLANVGDKLHKGAGILAANDIDQLYEGLISQWPEPASVLASGREPEGRQDLSHFPDTERMMVRDGLGYLPDDILVKVDRAAMGVSLETRVPMLDHTIAELAWRIPMHQKVRGNETKWALRQVLYRHVPRSLIERPKTGFGVPLQAWLRGPLRDWAEALLDEQRLRNEGYFVPGVVRQKWTEHVSGRRNWSYQLWGILMFQAWLDS